MPAQAFHLKNLSSHYDDWNCGDPEERWEGESILFSSNRGSAGVQFDFVPTAFNLRGNDTVKLELKHPSSLTLNIAAAVNTDEDELGPTFLFRHDSNASEHAAAMVFSRGLIGNHDFQVLLPSDGKFLSYPGFTFLPVHALGPLNSPFDEGYLTWYPGWNRVFFHSNRDGKYRIFQAELPMDSAGPFEWLLDPTAEGVQVSAVPGLAGIDGEERCPFLKGDSLFFVSDRSGGLGGFDIYLSLWNGSTWESPINLGPKVNSEGDEYRPHPIRFKKETGLIFSSNRPGGLGGFDLYLAGIKP